MTADKKILLVEDNPDDEQLTLIALQKGRVKNHVDVVRDGAEALDYIFRRGEFTAKQNDPLPTVVLLDLNLPKVSGIEVLRQIRENAGTKTLPVVILTSSREERDLIDGYSQGANSYIVKPVDIAQFTHAIQQLQLYWLVLNEARA